MKDFKIYISVASVLLIIYLVAQYNKPAPINWASTLYYKDKIPYGTYVLYNQLPQLFSGSKLSNTNLSLEEGLPGLATKSNYIIISKTADINSTDYKALADYIAAGNSVFIAAFNYRGKLADTLKLDLGYEYKRKKAGLNFTNPQLKQQHNYIFDKDIGNQYFSRFDTARAVVLGQNSNGKSNFLRFKFGKGYLFLCADPQLFSNFSLMTPNGEAYAAKALSYLPAANHLYWDEFQNGDIPEDQSPLRVFFSNVNLQWAYYISLLSLIIFVLYEMKRRQRIIPVIEPLTNSTLAFVNVVGQVYYEQRDNSNISGKKIMYFLEYLRTKYYLKTNPLDLEFVNSLSQKTGIDRSFINELVNHIKYVSAQQRVSDHELIVLNQLIDKFYNQAT